MLEKLESELLFNKSKEPLASIELDVDSLPENSLGYGSLVAKALKNAMRKSPMLRATVYVYESASVNFQKKTWSAFFGVVHVNEKILDELLNVFQSMKFVNAKFSDYIDPARSIRQFHTQEGHIWRPLEAGVWYAESSDDEEISSEDSVAPSKTSEVQIYDDVNVRASNPSRFRVARADAAVASIRRTIEEIFGLPEGSVALCGPDKRALRGDATIATLRKRWE
jgi:hypothetical protein